MYPWQTKDLSLDELQKLLDQRRKEMIEMSPVEVETCKLDELDQEVVSEWVLLLENRDEILRTKVKKENQTLLEKDLFTLFDLLAQIGKYDHSNTPEDLQLRLRGLYASLQIYLKTLTLPRATATSNHTDQCEEDTDVEMSLEFKTPLHSANTSIADLKSSSIFFTPQHLDFQSSRNTTSTPLRSDRDLTRSEKILRASLLKLQTNKSKAFDDEVYAVPLDTTTTPPGSESTSPQRKPLDTVPVAIDEQSCVRLCDKEVVQSFDFRTPVHSANTSLAEFKTPNTGLTPQQPNFKSQSDRHLNRGEMMLKIALLQQQKTKDSKTDEDFADAIPVNTNNFQNSSSLENISVSQIVEQHSEDEETDMSIDFKTPLRFEDTTIEEFKTPMTTSSSQKKLDFRTPQDTTPRMKNRDLTRSEKILRMSLLQKQEMVESNTGTVEEFADPTPLEKNKSSPGTSPDKGQPDSASVPQTKENSNTLPCKDKQETDMSYVDLKMQPDNTSVTINNGLTQLHLNSGSTPKTNKELTRSEKILKASLLKQQKYDKSKILEEAITDDSTTLRKSLGTIPVPQMTATKDEQPRISLDDKDKETSVDRPANTRVTESKTTSSGLTQVELTRSEKILRASLLKQQKNGETKTAEDPVTSTSSSSSPSSENTTPKSVRFLVEPSTTPTSGKGLQKSLQKSRRNLRGTPDCKASPREKAMAMKRSLDLNDKDDLVTKALKQKMGNVRIFSDRPSGDNPQDQDCSINISID